MKKLNKIVLLLTSSMLLACGGEKGLPKQKAITGDEALAIAQSIGGSTELREVLPPDEFYASMTFVGEETSKDSGGTKSKKSMSTIVISYSKKLQRFYMSESATEISDGSEETGLFEEWFEPTEEENVMDVYVASTGEGKVLKQHAVMDVGFSFETLVQEYFSEEANLEAASIFDAFRFSEEVVLENGEAYEAYYGSDNEQSLQAEEKFTYVGEYEVESVLYDENLLNYVAVYVVDLIVLEAHCEYDDLYVSKDGNETIHTIYKQDYVLQKSSKKMPKLNKSEFKTIS